MTPLILMTVCLLEQAQTPKVVVHDSQRVVIENKSVALSIDLQTGRFGLKWDRAGVSEIGGEIKFKNDKIVKTSDYLRHEVRPTDIQEIKDSLGTGLRITLRHLKPNSPTLKHVFFLYEDKPQAFVQLLAESTGKLESNYIAPMVVESETVTLAGNAVLQSLFVPFDNDMYIRYRSNNWAANSESCEVGAIYDNKSRDGIVIGSVDHDLWKSAVQTRKKDRRSVYLLKAYAGATNKWTHDKEIHGFLSGQEVASPRFMIGHFDDWRDGMETYADANAAISPMLPWNEDPPFGWNSWSAHMTELSASHAMAAVDFFAKDVPDFRNNGKVYVNLDSFWDNLRQDQQEAFVERAHRNGLKAGTYLSPFTCWGDLDSKVEGTNGRVLFRDIALKDHKGKPLPKLDGGWPLDPTHPETLALNRRRFGRFVKMGFDFVKLDFLSHGSLEGVFADPNVTTGVAAYRKGMQDIVDILSPEKVGRPFFISLSIAPLFPHGFGHSRRSSCDAFARIDQTEYMLNSTTYSWWSHGRIYQFNDPDHSVVYREHNQPVVTEAEGRSRLTASVIGGGMLLDGDDLTNAEAKERVQKLLSNQAVLDVARQGLPFRPVDGDTNTKATNTFYWQDTTLGTTYVAVFNYSLLKDSNVVVDLQRIGLKADKNYSITELWTGKKTEAKGKLRATLAPANCALFKLEASL